MYLITECSKLMVSIPTVVATSTPMLPDIAPSNTPISGPCVQVNEIDFLDSIMVLGFSEELNQHLLSVR